MKTFKYILLAILSVNIFLWLITYFLNINLFTILQIQTSNLAIEEPRYKLNANATNVKGNRAIEEPRYKLNANMQDDIFDSASFYLFDSECNRYGPFDSSEVYDEIAKGLTSKCLKEIPNENEVLINLHERREGGKATVKSNVTNLIYSFPGFEGDEETNTRIQLAIYQLPNTLRQILTSEVRVLNGCHPYGEALFNRCVYGVFDPVGYDADGKYGNEWDMTIWISDRGIESGRLKDILIHEAAHAYSYLVLRSCIVSDGTSFRELAHKRYGDEENLADIFVLYYGGKWTNYYQQDNIEYRDRSWMKDMIEYCDLYEQALSALSS